MNEWHRVDSVIRVEIRQYDRAQYAIWCRGERGDFPKSERLVWWRRPALCDRGYYFVETFHARALMDVGYICWSGYYKLFRPCASTHSRFHNASEIRLALRENKLPDPTKLLERVRGSVGRLRGPDVIAYHPQTHHWIFHEVKRNDSVKPHQLQALALLQHVYGSDVAVVRYVPQETPRRAPKPLVSAPLEFLGDPRDIAPPDRLRVVGTSDHGRLSD